MTTTYPALRGKFGTTEYYITTMRVSELVRMVLFPTDVPEWVGGSIEEQFQRKLDLRRINRDIAPYFASDPKRFSGSLVIATLHPDGIRFETIHKVTNSRRDSVRVRQRDAGHGVCLVRARKAGHA